MHRILIVDDDKLARKGLISIVPWEKCGFSVAGDVANGALALEFVEQHPVDLVVVDLTMPVLSGLDFIRECRERKLKLEFIVLSAHESFDYVQKALRLGVLDYISKLQMEQEDCVEIFRRAAGYLDRVRQEEKQSAGERKEPEEASETSAETRQVDEICEQIDRLAWVYHREVLEKLIEKGKREAVDASARYRIMFRMLHVIRQVFLVPLSEGDYPYSSRDMEWMRKIREALLDEISKQGESSTMEGAMLKSVIYMLRNLDSPKLTAESAADFIGMSRSYFSVSFKKYTGYSVNSFIRKERVELAKRAVQENPKISVGDAACLVGYHDEKYFAKVFQQREGISFSEYKKQEAHRVSR